MMLYRALDGVLPAFRAVFAKVGLTEQQWRVIRVLQEYGELEFRDLSRVACIQPASLTGILTRLERATLVRRTRSRSDQRRLHLSLSRAGLRRFETVSVESPASSSSVTTQPPSAIAATAAPSIRVREIEFMEAPCS